MTQTKLILATVAVVSLCFIPACTKDKSIPDSACVEVITWDTHINTLFQNHCTTGQGPGTGCHDAWIGDYTKAVNKVNDGTIEHEVIVTRDMPEIPNTFGIDALTEYEIQMVQCWIEQGTPKN